MQFSFYITILLWWHHVCVCVCVLSPWTSCSSSPQPFTHPQPPKINHSIYNFSNYIILGSKKKVFSYLQLCFTTCAILLHKGKASYTSYNENWQKLTKLHFLNHGSWPPPNPALVANHYPIGSTWSLASIHAIKSWEHSCLLSTIVWK